MNHDSFHGLGIAPGLLGLLDSLKFTVPTPIQRKAIPIAIEGKDIIGVAQTGTSGVVCRQTRVERETPG
jgi:superfamily II DNA/RNA helicase